MSSPFKIQHQMARYFRTPTGFVPHSTCSEPEPNQYVFKLALTEPGPQSGLKTQPQELPSSLEAKKPKNLFARFFGEEDEIVLLNGMIRFVEKHRSDPLANLDAFHRFVKADLNVEPTTVQLKHKIQKFKWKYIRNLRKRASGSARRLKAHEQRAYELSKLALANVYIRDQELPRSRKVAASGGGSSKSAAGEMEIVRLDRANISRIGAQLFETGKGVEGESKWLELQKAEMDGGAPAQVGANVHHNESRF